MRNAELNSAEASAASIANRFALPAPAAGAEPYGSGLINATFLVTAGEARYILQRINDRVFPKPERIMSNLSLLQGHLSTHPESNLRIPALIAARDGLPFVRDGRGGVWRLMELIANAEPLPRIDNLEQAGEVGGVLGRFHVLVSDLPADRLAVTLPGFHVTPSYVARFERVLAASAKAQTKEIAPLIAFVSARRDRADILETARQKGQVPMRVIHGDPKLDNILFDRTTDRAISLIDLDTVQPGLVHYDLGDCLRSCCNRAASSRDTDASFDLDLCRAILGAFADETAGLLGIAEIELLFDAIRLIPFELGLRFLTDHLEGDRYFRVTERGQNLRKARIQFALVADIETKERAIRDLVGRCFVRV